MTEFPHLFQPIQIGTMKIPNRIFMPPHGTNYADRIHNERLIRYYQERARGGVGLIIHEAVSVHPTGVARAGKVHAWDPEVVPGYRRVAEAVHPEGTKVICQLLHPGRQMTSMFSHLPLWAPSPIPCAENREMPHVMSPTEIAEAIAAFATAAHYCQEGGLDGVEIHAAHGYLIQQFLSPVSNTRQDDYGGSPEQRLRFLREILAAVRETVGTAFVVGMRISGDELVPGGLSATDIQAIVKEIEQDGTIDYVSVSVGNYSVHPIIIPDMAFPPGVLVPLAAGLKASGVHLPILVAGKIGDPDQAEAILAADQADMVGLARALIADPFLPLKTRTGRVKEIRPCIYCNQECRDRVGKVGDLGCTVNPAAGHEATLGEGTLAVTSQPQHVVVIGGGLAGLETALTATRRGHHVTLFEAQETLGGQAAFAARVPLRADYGRIVTHLIDQVLASDVTVRLGERATVAGVRELAPDVVVVATGAQPRVPTIPGVAQAVTVWDVLRDGVDVGERVVVYDDGEGFWPFCSTVAYLAGRGHTVTAVTRLNTVGASIPALSIPPLYEQLFQHDVTFRTLQRVVAIADGTVTVRHSYRGTDEVLPVDTVILAAGADADDGLVGDLRAQGIEPAVIGDALAPRRASDAIREGHLLARRL